MPWKCLSCGFVNDEAIICGVCDTLQPGYIHNILEDNKGNSFEKTKDRLVLTFGRFQPPTKGHKILFDEVSRLATQQNADAFIFVANCGGGSCLSNPLPINVRLNTLKLMYPSTNLKFIGLHEHNMGVNLDIIISELIETLGYLPENITVIEGSDRVKDFDEGIKLAIIKKQGMVEIAERALQKLRLFETLYKDAKINVIQAGRKRTEGNQSEASISGTMVKRAAIDGDKEKFFDNVMIGDMTEKDAIVLMNMIRKLDSKPPIAGGRRKMRKTRKIRKGRGIHKSRKI